jgi:flagellar biosynthesis/type III secretory pathway M-ring protein FliF/YscJ
MNAIVGGWIVFGLVIAFLLVRMAMIRRKKREAQLRLASRARKPRPVRMTDRAEMRANDDPTTFAHNTTTRGRASENGAPRSEPQRKR